jgi:hypothetical protein
MNSIYKILNASAVISLIIGSTGTAFCQSSLEPGQPVVGGLHVVESNLDAQLTHDYNAGLIDPLELANMRRDLDAIKVKEEKYRMRTHGITDEDEQRISDLLTEFQGRLLAKVSEKGHVATATYVEMR